jgi:hypothetical protein
VSAERRLKCVVYNSLKSDAGVKCILKGRVVVGEAGIKIMLRTDRVGIQ